MQRTSRSAVSLQAKKYRKAAIEARKIFKFRTDLFLSDFPKKTDVCKQ